MTANVGVLGSGIVGQTLANGFVRHGYDVMIGTNNPGKHAELKQKTNEKAKVGSFEEAAKFGGTIVLAAKGVAAEAAVKIAGIGNLKGKIVIDATNPIADAPHENEQVLRATIDCAKARNKRLVRVPKEHVIDRWADRRPAYYGSIAQEHHLERKID